MRLLLCFILFGIVGLKNLQAQDIQASPYSLLSYAISSDNLENATLAIKRGVDINKLDANGNAPIHLTFFSVCNTSNIFQLLLKEGALVNIKNNQGDTPLLLAVKGSSTKQGVDFLTLIQMLLSKNADVNCKNNQGITPLISLCSPDLSNLSELERKEALGLLLRRKAQVNNCIENNGIGGITPLMLASRAGYHELVEMLLTENADISLKDSKNKTALDYALSADPLTIPLKIRMKILQLLFNKVKENKTEGDSLITSYIRISCSASYSNVLQGKQAEMGKIFFNKNELQPNIDLVEAVYSGNGAKAEEALTKGAEINLTNSLALVCEIRGAAGNSMGDKISISKYELAKTLISMGADVKTCNQDALYNACNAACVATYYDLSPKPYYDIIQLLIKNGASPNLQPLPRREPPTPIKLACKYGSLKVLTKLLDAGAKINQTDIVTGNNELHELASFYELSSFDDIKQIAKLLLSKGVEINAENNKGQTPLSIATLMKEEAIKNNKVDLQKKYEELINLLIRMGGR